MTRLLPVREIASHRLDLPPDERWIDDMTWVPVSATEIHLACRYFPIAARFDGTVPRLGLIVSSRYLVHPLRDATGRWRGAYRPIALRCFPFSAAPQTSGDPRDDVLIEPESPYLSEAIGVPLVEPDGQPGAMLRELHRLFGLLQHAEEHFAKSLDQWLIAGLLAPIVTTDEDTTDVPTLHVVDPAQFHQLKPAALGAMARDSLLGVDLAVAAHFSLLTLRPQFRPKAPAEPRHQTASIVTPMFAIEDLSLALDDGELVSLWNIDALRVEVHPNS